MNHTPYLVVYRAMVRAVRFILSRSGWRLWAVACWLCACAGNVEGAELESKPAFRVSVLYWSMNIPGQVAMRRGLEAEAEVINAEARRLGKPLVSLEPAVAGDGESGIENQIRQMRAAIGAKVDAIVVQPTDNAALAAPLQEANRAKIPVVAYDQYIGGGKLAAYRTSDNRQAGYLNGEYIANRFAKRQPVRLVCIEYPHVSSTVERLDGFVEALEKSGCRYQILKAYVAVEPVSGRAAGKALLKDFPEKGSVDVVFAVNDGGGLSVVEALVAAGRDEIVVASVDGDPASVENIRAGRLTAIDCAQFCGPLGAEALRAAYALLRGEKPPYHALVPVFPITKETIQLYPGWNGPIPAPFGKPWPSREPEWSNQLRIVKP